MYTRINRKTMLILFLSVLGFVVIYLYYVKQQRQQAIATYLPNPQTGDIYKVATENSVVYWQVKETSGGAVFFYRSLFSASAASDILLNHFDSSNVFRYSKADLLDIKNGRWDNAAHDYTSLVDITRAGSH